MRHLLALGVVLAAAHLSTAAGAEKPPATIPELITQLSSNDFHARHSAARQLGNLGLAAREAVPALGKLLRDPAPEVQRAAARALGQIGQPSVGVLVEALKDRDAGVRTRAALALGQAGPDVKEAVPALIEALKDKHAEVRLATVDALGEMGADGKEAAPALARQFHDRSPRVREHVGRTLAAIGPAAVVPLGDALRDEDVEVRLDVLKTLLLFGPQAKKALVPLRQSMNDEDPRVRAATAEVLGKMGLEAADAVPELLAALKDKHRLAHNKAANALVLLTMAGVPDLLEKVRAAENKEAWMLPALQLNQAQKAANPLTPLLNDLKDKDPQVRSKAALMLGGLGAQAQSAVPALNRALTDDDVQVRLSAAMAIARIERGKAEVQVTVQRILREIQDRLDDWQALLTIAAGPGAAGPQRLRAGLTPAQASQLVTTYITFKVTMRAQGGWAMKTAIEKRLEQQLQLLQDEGVPALVDGLNQVVSQQLGDC